MTKRLTQHEKKRLATSRLLDRGLIPRLRDISNYVDALPAETVEEIVEYATGCTSTNCGYLDFRFRVVLHEIASETLARRRVEAELAARTIERPR